MNTAPDQPSVSVVVPSYRREETLVDTLKDLLAQDYPNYDIIVVDQTERHEPETEAFLRALPESVRILRRKEANLPAARNAGIREAHGEVVLFVDDDVRLERSFVSAHARNYGDPRLAAVAGPVLNPQRQWAATYPTYLSRRPWKHFLACWQYEKRREVCHAPGGNMSIRRSLFEKVGFFDERYTGPGLREESDFFARVWAAHHRMVYDPTCLLIHLGTQGQGGCWTAFDGLVSSQRIHNHAYFVLKNFPRRFWPLLFIHSFRSMVARRDVFKNPHSVAVMLKRFWAGWHSAWKVAPRESWLGRSKGVCYV